jgi:hypothetical protein
MIYVYRSKVSDSAKLLADGLEGDRVKIFSDGRFQCREGGTIIRPRRHDVIVCWGEELPAIEGPRILNGAPILNKLEAALKLKADGVETVEVAAIRPAVNQVADLFEPGVAERVNRTQAQALSERIRQYLATPIPAAETWLPRTFNHLGGHDLLNAPARPDYFSKKENIIEEFRIHIFNGKSIRAGVKKHRDGVEGHSWIRSYDSGWNICYNDFHSKKAMRALAVKAVEVLGLQFGAVDLGKTADGRLLVLEVNRAPGLEGGTVTSYVNAVQQWVEEE